MDVELLLPLPLLLPPPWPPSPVVSGVLEPLEQAPRASAADSATALETMKRRPNDGTRMKNSTRSR